MLNEAQEFYAYTHFPEYCCSSPSDTKFLGRFTMESIMDFLGFERIFTILARGYLFSGDGEPQQRAALARDALCAWCSIPDEKSEDWKFSTDFRHLHDRFPELVDENGNGWFIRHIYSIAECIAGNPEKVSKSARKYLPALQTGFDRKWRDKVRQFQVPIFLESSEAIWEIRFDDVIANALPLGPLRNMGATVTPQQLERLSAFVTPDVKLEHLTTLVAYYEANKPEDSDWVVLPASSFNMYFGSTAFSKKVLPAITDKVIRRSPMSHGSARFQVMEEFL